MAFFILRIIQRCFLSFGLLPKAIAIFVFIQFSPSFLFSNCTVSCVQSFNLSLGLEGTFQVIPDDLLVDPDCNPVDFHVVLYDENSQAIGDVITCAQVGQTITAQVIETASGNSCTTAIQVFDNLPPTINCMDTTIICGANYDPYTIGFPEVFDNCTDLDSTDLSFEDEVVNYDCLEIINGDTINAVINRTWSVVDENGNTRTCIQQISLIKSTVWDVLFPPDRNDLMLPSLDCNQDPLDLSLTGEPTIQGIPVSDGLFCDIIVSSEDTQIPNCGENSSVIIRAWTIVDWCTGAFRNHSQIIKLVDATAPVISCPQDLTFQSNVYDCFGTVTLLPATATDDCSSVTITPSWAFGTGYGPFNEVPLGTYPVTYTAEDACGNISTCQSQVTLIDVAPPISICKPSIQYNLGIDGMAKAFPTHFDEGTYDNCGLSHFEISRDGNVFLDSIYFSCEDIDQSPVAVTIRAWDVNGNYNDCGALAYLNDKLFPVVDCPDDITINCFDDYLDLSITGSPAVFDNCDLDSLYFVDQVNLNSCAIGEVLRTWIVIDGVGHVDSCLQTITMVDVDTLEVVFPNNYSTNVCNAVLDTATTGAPIFINKNCELLAISFSDDTLMQATPACYIVNRHWQIYDWCSYNPVTEEGYWSYVQILSVTDDEDPILNVPNDTIVFHLSDTCGLFYFNINVASATECSNQISIINNSEFADENGADASGWYPPGVHQIQFYAEDGCGNSATDVFSIQILDGKEPTAVCNGGLQFELGLNGELTIQPNELDGGSFDNCTASENLILSLSQNSFTCEDLGFNLITLTVEDEQGLVSSCNTSIFIQDNQGYCPGGNLMGVVQDWNDTGVNQVDIHLSGVVTDTLQTNLEGEFSKSQLEVGQNVLITPKKTGNFREGLSTLDVVLLSRHLVALDIITNPYQILAGDVNRDGVITPFDLIEIQRLILFINDELANSNSWRFAPGDHTFPVGGNPLANQPQEFIAINNIPDGDVAVDFVAMKMGDVSGNANPSLIIENGAYSDQTDEVKFELKEVERTIQFLPIIEFPKEVYGVEISIPIEDSENVELESKLSADVDMVYHVDTKRNMVHVSISSPRGFMIENALKMFEIRGARLDFAMMEMTHKSCLYIDENIREKSAGLEVGYASEVLEAMRSTNR